MSSAIGFCLPSFGQQTLADGIEEAEFTLTGHFVADIGLAGEPEEQADGSLAIAIEALTVAE